MAVQTKRKHPSKTTKKRVSNVPHSKKNAAGHPKKKSAPPKKVHKKETGKQRPKTKKNKRRQRKLLFLELGLTVLIISILFFLLNLFVFSFPKVTGFSMSPALADGDVVYVNRLAKIRRFEMISFKEPSTGNIVVRRVIGLPGEDIRYEEERLFVNNEEKPERFIENEVNQSRKDGVVWTEDFTLKKMFKVDMIPEGKYLVLGDNRPYATDSRYYGLIDEKDITGVVKVKILPLQNATSY